LRPRDEHAEPATERIGGDPRFMWAIHVFAASDNCRLDALVTVAGDAFDREYLSRPSQTGRFNIGEIPAFGSPSSSGFG
jgi:hypothetical protein